MKVDVCVMGMNAEFTSHVVAAICRAFGEVEEFRFVAFSDEIDTAFLSDIDRELGIRSNNEFYSKALRTKRRIERIHEINSKAFCSASLIDITGVSKEISSEIIMLAVSSRKKICSLNFLSTDRKSPKEIGVDKHKLIFYSDLRMVRNAIKNRSIIRGITFCMIFIFILISCVWLFRRFFDFNFISDDFVNFISLLIGLGGLYITYISTREF